MKKLYIFLLLFLSILLVSCSNSNNEPHHIFKFATASPITDIHSNIYIGQETRTKLYIQDKDNKSCVLGMAKSMPIDVTNEYIDEKWNIKPGEAGKAWKIELRDDLCWENGEKITAQDFIDTIVITYHCGFDIIKGTSYSRDIVEAGIISIEDLGIRAVDNSLILIFEKKIAAAKLCKDLSLSFINLVHKKTYESSFLRDEDGNIVYTDVSNIPINEYGTSVDKYLSYGPYKLVEMNQNIVRLVKNENWFGYKYLSDEYYQTDEIVFEYLEDYSNSYNLLVEGKYHYIYANAYLNANKDNSINDIDKKYIKQFLYLDPNVNLLVINPDYERLLEKQEEFENANYTILCIPEFRQALMYSLDLNSLITPLENKRNSYYRDYSKYCLHPFYTYRTDVNNYTGEYYHDSDEFKQLYEECFSEFFDEADKKQKAIELFNEAYRKALEEGYLTEDDVIYIEFAIPYDRASEAKVIIARWEEVVAETIFADKIKFIELYSAIIGQVPYADIYWTYYYSFDNCGLDGAIDLYEQIAPPKYKNQKYRKQELNITFNKIIDINGKEYRDVTLIATIDEWLKGYNDENVSTTILLSNGQTEEVIFTYKDNPEVTNKIMAECEKLIFSDYCLLPTLENYDVMIINDNVNLNYESDAHYYSIDFRYITYN